jgi:hypothetical protein
MVLKLNLVSHMKTFTKLIYFLLKKIDPRSIYYIKNIPVDKILLGGEGDLPGWKYSLMSGELARPSKLATDSVHVKYLRQFGDKQNVSDSEIIKSSYFQNALDVSSLLGEYFPGAKNSEEILMIAKNFLYQFKNESITLIGKKKFSRKYSLVKIFPIKKSDYYQINQGNHRLAIQIVKGRRKILARVYPFKKQITPIQFLLKNTSWEKGEKIIYQPLSAPELYKEYVIARRCQDRFEMMTSYIKSELKLDPKETSYLDLGSYFGWFVNSFLQSGFNSYGVERDAISIQIGEILFKDIRHRVHQNDMYKFLSEGSRKFDVISCLSIMHHLINRRESIDPLKLLHAIDKATNKILFFEMGQETESWFKTSLKGWNDSTIPAWVLNNSSFKSFQSLGKDSDNVGKFKENFHRTLFVFTK